MIWGRATKNSYIEVVKKTDRTRLLTKSREKILANNRKVTIKKLVSATATYISNALKLPSW